MENLKLLGSLFSTGNHPRDVTSGKQWLNQAAMIWLRMG
jgi:hypothetical protein